MGEWWGVPYSVCMEGVSFRPIFNESCNALTEPELLL